MTRPTAWRVEAANAPTHLREVSDEMDEILDACGASEATRLAARLVCEEVVLNAFEHGGARFVTISHDRAADPQLLVFEDDGVSFDPSTRTIVWKPDTPAEPSPRGRGLILIRGWTKRIEHRRDDGRNRLMVLLVD